MFLATFCIVKYQTIFVVVFVECAECTLARSASSKIQTHRRHRAVFFLLLLLLPSPFLFTTFFSSDCRKTSVCIRCSFSLPFGFGCTGNIHKTQDTHMRAARPLRVSVCCAVCVLFSDYKLKSLHVNISIAINISLRANSGARMHGRQRTRNAGCNKSTTNKYISSA